MGLGGLIAVVDMCGLFRFPRDSWLTVTAGVYCSES